MATTIADIAAARRDYLDESGRYVHVIADGSTEALLAISSQSLLPAAPTASCAGTALARAKCSPGEDGTGVLRRVTESASRVANESAWEAMDLWKKFFWTSHNARGVTNLMGALRHAMAANGYSGCERIPARRIGGTGEVKATTMS